MPDQADNLAASLGRLTGTPAIRGTAIRAKTDPKRNVATAIDARPTRVRHGVVAFAVALAMVTYLDRVCISTVAKGIRRDLSLSEEQMSYVFGAFALAYAIFEIPTAWWADRRGCAAC